MQIICFATEKLTDYMKKHNKKQGILGISCCDFIGYITVFDALVEDLAKKQIGWLTVRVFR